jgi:NAD(P)-dependent dehydrogenase (short-subunit alcohol dehydrogenase family)
MILQDRIAVATASGSGIGRAGARIMAREGALVVVADRSAEGAEETAELVRAAGGLAETVPTDVTDDDAVAGLIAGTVERHGRIDILHSHAGVQVGGGIEEVEPEGLDLSYQVNGTILLTSSNAGVVPDYGMLAYLTTKAAVVMMAQQMALDLGKHGIRVNALCPGWVDTPFNAAYIHQVGGRAATEKLIQGRVPLGRWGTADDVAEAILYLVSDRSSYMTGQAFVLDGGEFLVGAGQEG